MSDTQKAGAIGWIDLTVPEAEKAREFYQAVAGWQAAPVDMGGYSDYTMSTAAGTAVAGVCHKRGVNAGQPPVWMIYITVADLAASLQHCRELGGTVLAGPHSTGHGQHYAVIQDPAGAVCALYQAG
jgi:uncharacterized protein